MEFLDHKYLERYSTYNIVYMGQTRYSYVPATTMIAMYITMGVSTAEGGRGHVTAYTMCTPSKIQMNGPDILNIDRSATE